MAAASLESSHPSMGFLAAIRMRVGEEAMKDWWNELILAEKVVFVLTIGCGVMLVYWVWTMVRHAL